MNIKRSGSIKLMVAAVIQLLVLSPAHSQPASVSDDTGKIEFPDLPEYLTLKCDFHMHTVFSDGYVWPSVRVQEAVREGLDAISITDHLELQPKRNDIPHPDHNRSYELARQASRGTDLIVINGAEITRGMPPGHANALFLKDANKLERNDFREVYREARSQGAFVFWNHPHWTSQQANGVATLTEVHRELISEGLISGIEVYNESTYSDEALEIARANGLTILGNSDLHGLADWQFNTASGGHRPVTLVFAEEKSEKAIQEALEQGRTAVWFDNTLVGDARYLTPLVEASLVITRVGETMVQTLFVENQSDAAYILENLSGYTLHNMASVFVLPAHKTTSISVKTLDVLHPLELRFRVLNAFTTPDKHPEIVLRVE